MKPSFIISCVSAGAVITIIMLLIYATVQQNYRMTANDPQVQLARDISERLREGKSVEKIFPPDTIDISHGLGVFVVLYNSGNQPLRSSAVLNGKPPQLPAGVFNFAKANGEDWISWQPQPGVRMAMVMVHIRSSPVAYIAVGRSLKEVETRELSLRQMVFVCWLICMAVMAIHAFLVSAYNRKRKGEEKYL